MASNPNLKVVAFVHAKGTSERLPGKNLRVLGDRPLICHAIANALAADLVDAVVIDSEDDEILRVGEEAGAVPLKRPAELATNETTGDDLAGWQAGNVPLAEIILQVVPTSPFVCGPAIDTAVRLMGDSNADSVTAVRTERLYIWSNCSPGLHRFFRGGRIPNSQDLLPTSYETTGLYVVRREYAAQYRRRVNPNPGRYVAMRVSQREAIDINTEEDFEFAEIAWKGMHC